MRVRVTSGNVAVLTLQARGNRGVVDAEWDHPPTSLDIEELMEGLALSTPVLSVQIEDAAARAEFTRTFLQDEFVQ